MIGQCIKLHQKWFLQLKQNILLEYPAWTNPIFKEFNAIQHLVFSLLFYIFQFCVITLYKLLSFYSWLMFQMPCWL